MLKLLGVSYYVDNLYIHTLIFTWVFREYISKPNSFKKGIFSICYLRMMVRPMLQMYKHVFINNYDIKFQYRNHTFINFRLFS